MRLYDESAVCLCVKDKLDESDYLWNYFLVRA